MYRLKREADFLSSGEQAYESLIDRIQNPPEEIKVALNEESIESKIEKARNRIAAARAERLNVQRRRDFIAQQTHEAKLVKDALLARINSLTFERNSLRDQLDSLEGECNRVAVKLKKYMQINVINDAFYIWYIGPFGTINNFRMGTLPSKVINWDEINAAMGQAVLAVSIVAARASFQFKKFVLAPMGSFPKVYKIDDRRSAMQLYYIYNPINVFPKRNFNTALAGFLTCVHELGEFTKSKDPTLALPYTIYVAEGKIHDQSVFWANDDDEWTRALKFLLTDIKWLIAWATKHCNNYTIYSSKLMA